MSSPSSSAPKLWAGRFAEETDALVHQFNASLRFDRRLWPVDIEGSIAHVKMLGECGIIAQADAETIQTGLEALAADLKSGADTLPEDAEDVHMAVETRLTERLGPVAGRLHTARSRNDQVATDLRLYTRGAIDKLSGRLTGLQNTLVTHSEAHLDTLLPGMTHLQHAQPVRLAHHLLAYFWMLARDVDRLTQARARVNILPLGAGALAGTTFPISRERVAALLGFDGVCENSLDAVSDRDFVIETLAALSLTMLHLSRLCEELILWSTPEFGWAKMGDNVTTGSSIMPQKKNPDVAELVRGKTGRVVGDLVSLLMTLKGLPLAYNKDMQEDKEALFDALDTTDVCLAVMDTLLKNTEFNTERMAASLHGDFSTATDLADYLVRQGLPFRQAHEVVGKIVGECVRNGRVLEDLTAAELAAASPLFEGADPAALVSPRGSADARMARGGTGRDAVQAQLARAKAQVSEFDSETKV